MSERKAHFSLPQEIHRPLLHPIPPPSLGTQAQYLPRAAGGEVGVVTALWYARVGTSPVWPGRGEGGVHSQVEQPVR